MTSWFYVVLAGMVALSIPAALAYAARHRWGHTSSAEPIGQGAYRGGIARTFTARSIPANVFWPGMLACTWGMITGLVFVPAGGLLLLVLADPPGDLVYASSTVFALITTAIVISGLLYAYMTFASAIMVLRRSAGAIAAASNVEKFSYAHHLIVWIAMTPIAFASSDTSREAVIAAAGLAVPCGIGVAVGLALRRARRTLEALDHADLEQVSGEEVIADQG